jgi:hypothetical protein
LLPVGAKDEKASDDEAFELGEVEIDPDPVSERDALE